MTVLKKARNPIKIARTIKPTKRKRIRMVVKSLTRKLKQIMMTQKTQRRMEMRRKISKKVLMIRRMIRRSMIRKTILRIPRKKMIVKRVMINLKTIPNHLRIKQTLRKLKTKNQNPIKKMIRNH